MLANSVRCGIVELDSMKAITVSGEDVIADWLTIICVILNLVRNT